MSGRSRDLSELGERTVVSALGRAQGLHLLALANAIDDRPVDVGRDPKSIGHEETYPTDITDLDRLERELVRLADAVASRLRDHGVGGRTITLKIRYAGFRTITRSVTLDSPVDTGPELVAAVRPTLRALDLGPGIRLLGVSAGNLGEPNRQLSLLDDRESPSRAAGAIDEIRARFGTEAIGPASAVGPRGLRVARKGGQQWGPDEHPPG